MSGNGEDDCERRDEKEDEGDQKEERQKERETGFRCTFSLQLFLFSEQTVF